MTFFRSGLGQRPNGRNHSERAIKGLLHYRRDQIRLSYPQALSSKASANRTTFTGPRCAPDARPLLTWSREMQTRVTFMGAASMTPRTRWHRCGRRRPCAVRFAPEYAISVQLIGEYDRQNDNDPNQSEFDG